MSTKQRNKNMDIGNSIVKRKITVGILEKDKATASSTFTWILWRQVKKKLQEKGITIKEVIIEDPNYDNEVKNVGKGKYDILVGGISVLSRRAKLANYTQPLMFDEHVIVFESKYTYKDSELYKIITNILSVSLLFFSLGTIFSLLLYFFGNHYASKKHRFKWHFWGVFGAILGEPGSVVERVDITKNANLLISFIILLVFFFFGVALNAAFTRNVLKHSIESDKDPIGTNIKGMKFLVSHGSSMKDTVEDEKATAVSADQKGSLDIQDSYLKDKKGTQGFITDLTTWGSKIKNNKKYRGMMKSDYQFPYDAMGWLVNKNQHGLLEVLDQVLVDMRSQNIIQKACKKIFPWMSVTHCTT